MAVNECRSNASVVGGGGKSGGIGGGGGGGGDEGDKAPQDKGKGGGFPGLAGLMKGWEERVQYDAEFPVKVFIEQVGGMASAMWA